MYKITYKCLYSYFEILKINKNLLKLARKGFCTQYYVDPFHPYKTNAMSADYYINVKQRIKK